jgi:drug/metabolite transporter (DMT)-like permease
VSHFTFEILFSTIFGRLILFRQFDVRQYLALGLMVCGTILACVPWTPSSAIEEDKINVTLAILCMAGSKGSWVLGCVMQKKWLLMRGYLRRK